jgi:hypothetical protein
MSNDDAERQNQDGQPLSDLFREVFDLADQISSRINRDQVREKLGRIIEGAEQPVPELSPSIFGGNVSFFEACGDPKHLVIDAKIQTAEHLIRKARREYAAIMTDAQVMLEEAAKARQDAVDLLNQARSYDDVALKRAAAIVTEAKESACEIIQAAKEAAEQYQRAAKWLFEFDRDAVTVWLRRVVAVCC